MIHKYLASKTCHTSGLQVLYGWDMGRGQEGYGKHAGGLQGVGVYR